MRVPIVLCDVCGSTSVRRSKRQSFSELVRMYLGIYPFRCMDCTARFWVSVWLVSKLPFAKCPKCLNVQLTVWPEKYFAPNVWRNLAILLGARRYRCMPCRHNFVSFRPRLPDSAVLDGADVAENAIAADIDAIATVDSNSPEQCHAAASTTLPPAT
jgi:DNA-directed RNA polymerase subunit RPC12/RpoP